MRTHAAVVVFAFTLAACGGSGSSPSPTNPSPPSPVRWVLSGAVLEAGTQTAVAGARMEIFEGNNQGRTATTDAQGRYRLDNLEPGTFSIRATAAAFETQVRAVTLGANQVVDFGLLRTGGRSIAGTIIDAISDRTLSGVTVRIDGVGEAMTGGDGTFLLAAGDIEQVRAVLISSPSTVERATRLRVPGPSATLSLMPGSLDLRAFDEMFRSNGAVLRRWVAAPRVVVQNRVLQFTTVTEPEYTAIDAAMSDPEITALLEDLSWALPQLTGSTFTGFAEERRESAAAGERVRVMRNGLIVVARYEGLTAATGFWGYSRWAWNGAGEMQAGIIMLDVNFDTSGSPFRRSLRAHELGHSLGYNHVIARESVMNASARTEPNGFDRDGSKLAFLRPPLNRSPDVDPDPFTGNLRGLTTLTWSRGAH